MVDAAWVVNAPPDFARLTGIDPEALVQDGHAASFGLTAHPFAYERSSPLARPGGEGVDPSLKLNMILVKPERQNNGTGTTLLQAAVRYAELKRLPLWLCAIGDEQLPYGGDDVYMTTERLVQWYGKHGFVPVSEADGDRYGIDCGGPRVAMIRYPH